MARRASEQGIRSPARPSRPGIEVSSDSPDAGGHRDARLSTLDLFGSAFTVLAGPGGESWCGIAAQLERELGVPIDRYCIGGPGLRDLDSFTDAYGLGEDGAVLVRPDGHVAWRRTTGPRTGEALRAAIEQILAR